MSTREEWSLRLAAWPLFCSASLLSTCLYIASFPGRLNRWSAVSVLIVPASAAFRTAKDLSPDDVLNDIYLRFVIILVSHITYLSFRHVPPHEKGREVDSGMKASAWRSGYKLVFNARGVGTSWEVPYLWPGQKSTAESRKPLSTGKKEDASKTSSQSNVATRGKLAGISIRFAYLLLNFVLICCYYEFFSTDELGFTLADYAPFKASILRRLAKQFFGVSSTPHVTKRELAVRAREAVSNFIPDYLMLSAYHDFFAIFFMTVGLDQSWEWPPLFGQITEAYSMRRFWSLFWHKLIYRSFNSHAAVLSSSLGINRKTMFSRIINNYLVFVLSGIMHGAVMWHFDTKCAWSASMRYWLLQPIAFVLEGVVQFYWGKFRRRSLGWVNAGVLGVFERAVGYAWVVAWLLWESTKRSFALAECNA